jgi:uncharacterized membrane protein YfcA
MDSHDAVLLVVITCVSFALAFYGAAVGLILGHLRLPLLIYYLPSAAAGSATNLAISGLGALTGTLRHARDGRISCRVLAIMGIPSVAGALVGARLLVAVEPIWVRVFVGGFLLISGYNLIRNRPAAGDPVRFGFGVRLLLEVVIGLALGFLAVCTGLMMGSLRLPMMIRWLRIDPRVAVGSNMAIGCLTALAGTVAFWVQGRTFYWLPLLVVGPPTILGGYLGARWTGHFRKEALQRLVGWTIAVTGLGMVGEGLGWWRAAWAATCYCFAI